MYFAAPLQRFCRGFRSVFTPVS
jgi:phage-related protein